jgi:hypothetical protein
MVNVAVRPVPLSETVGATSPVGDGVGVGVGVRVGVGCGVGVDGSAVDAKVIVFIQKFGQVVVPSL